MNTTEGLADEPPSAPETGTADETGEAPETGTGTQSEGVAREASLAEALTARDQVIHELDSFRDGLDRLLAALDSWGLDDLSPLDLIDWMRQFECVRNRLALVDHRWLATAERIGLAAKLTHTNLKSVLVQALRLSPAEASRRVRAAAAVGDRMSMVGEQLDPIRPLLAAGQQAGDISTEQVAVIERALESVDRPGLDPQEVDEAERILARHALTFGPHELRKIARHLIDAIHPDGTLPEEELIRDRRDLRLTRLTDGSFRVEGRLTPSLGAQLNAVLCPLAKPRNPLVVTGTGVECRDERTFGQRNHDALEEMCGRLLRVGGLPMSGGTPASVIVTIDYKQLLSQTGHGETSDGTILPAAEVLRLANEADILPAVLATSGVLVDLGRSRRVANQNQTFALIARDGGCSFPGCSHPPEYCDRHHIKGWIDGGATNVNNLTLLCRYHHTHFLGHGWTCALNDDGLPAWTPPRWLDPDQQSLTNNRIKAKHALAS
jgi:hypothetical protein